MEMKPFKFRPRMTTAGRFYIEVFCGDEVVATGKYTHPTADAALAEVNNALACMDLQSVIKPNGKLLELIEGGDESKNKNAPTRTPGHRGT
jgi:hypothetical protein